MDSSSEDRIGTPIKVNQFLKDEGGSFTINPDIEITRALMETEIENFFQEDSTATRPLGGYTEVKGGERSDLEKNILKVRAACVGYFTKNPDASKMMIVKRTDTEIFETRDKELYTVADQIHDVADPIKTLLGPYLVAAADVDAIPTNMTAYMKVLELPRTEEGRSMAAGNERDRIIGILFNEKLASLDNYMVPWKYENLALYERYQTARAIDSSGGLSDSTGYDNHNYELAPGASKSFHAAVAGSQQLYFRQIGGTVGALVCTAALVTDSCTAGFTLVAGETVKKTFTELGLAAGSFINFTNPGSQTITIRAGLKT